MLPGEEQPNVKAATVNFCTLMSTLLLFVSRNRPLEARPGLGPAGVDTAHSARSASGWRGP